MTGCSRPTRRRRGIARRLYQAVRDLPIVSPHGHCDPSWFARDEPFSDPATLLIVPDHYLFRMLYSQGVPLERLGIGRRDGAEVETDPRAIWRLFAEHYHLFRGTPSRMWLDHVLAEVLGVKTRLDAETADDVYNHIANRLAEPEFRPPCPVRPVRHRGAGDHGIAAGRSAAPPGDPRQRLGWPGDHGLPAGPGGRSGFRGIRRQCRGAGPSYRLRHGKLGRLSGSAGPAARLLRRTWRHLDRPWPPDRHDERPWSPGLRVCC